MAEPAGTLEVACVQNEHRSTLEATLDAAGELVAQAVEDGAELVVLPEYFYLPRLDRDGDAFPDVTTVPGWLQRTSKEHGILLCGNAREQQDGRVYNVCHLHHRGEHLGTQRKVHPMPREAEFGLSGGTSFPVFDVLGTTVGIIVCADVLFPEVARILTLEGAEVLAVPVMSPYRGARDDDPTRDARESLFVARAYDNGAFLLKAGGFSDPDHGVAGRSLVASPWGLLARYRDAFEPQVLRASLDLQRLRAFREESVGLHRRAPWAYGPLTSPSLHPTDLRHPDDDAGDAS